MSKKLAFTIAVSLFILLSVRGEQPELTLAENTPYSHQESISQVLVCGENGPDLNTMYDFRPDTDNGSMLVWTVKICEVAQGTTDCRISDTTAEKENSGVIRGTYIGEYHHPESQRQGHTVDTETERIVLFNATCK